MSAPAPFTAAELAPVLRPLEEAGMLPGRAYTDEAVAAWEAEHFFLGGWMCVGHVQELSQRGEYVTVEAGGESFLVIADDDGAPHAFFNVCRHRGARIMQDREGKVGRLQCPYHAWSYGMDGSLKNAPHTDEIEGFDPACHGLGAVDTAVCEGLVFINPLGGAGPIEEHVGGLADELGRFKLSTLKRGGRKIYDVKANWKAVIENYSECLHCPGVHPELNKLSHYLTGESIIGPGAWCGGSMTLDETAATMGRNGGGNGRPAIEGLTETDKHSVYYYSLFANTLISLHPDYVMLHTLWPRGAGRTEVTCDWLFEPATMAAPGFDPSDAIDFWDQVNQEDWYVCEITQQGLGSRAYRPGRFTSQEGEVQAFDRLVAEAYLSAGAVPVA